MLKRDRRCDSGGSLLFYLTPTDIKQELVAEQPFRAAVHVSCELPLHRSVKMGKMLGATPLTQQSSQLGFSSLSLRNITALIDCRSQLPTCRKASLPAHFGSHLLGGVHLILLYDSR